MARRSSRNWKSSRRTFASCFRRRSARRWRRRPRRGPTALTTLVVSDLHLGARNGTDLLRRPALRAPLLEALEGVERLVLLGDALELRQGPAREALAAALPFFAQIGAALGSEGEIVLVPGNHDHALVAPWLERRRRVAAPAPLGLAQSAAWEEGDVVAELAQGAAPARVSLSYPGIWLRADVYATHGHYLDRHTTVPTFERLGAGVMGKVTGRPPAAPAAATVDDYEASLEPIYAWSYALAQHADEGASGTQAASLRVWQTLAGNGHRPLRRRALATLFPLVVAGINRGGLGPLRPNVSSAELGRAGVVAMGEALRRLGVAARHVIFGHTHRAGPREDDDHGPWSTASGTRLLNSGCWVYERHFLGAEPYGSPYWPGHAVRVEDDPAIAPALMRLLGERGHAELGARSA